MGLWDLAGYPGDGKEDGTGDDGKGLGEFPSFFLNGGNHSKETGECSSKHGFHFGVFVFSDVTKLLGEMDKVMYLGQGGSGDIEEVEVILVCSPR